MVEGEPDHVRFVPARARVLPSCRHAGAVAHGDALRVRARESGALWSPWIFVAWFLGGALVGAVAAVLMRRGGTAGVFVNVMVGVGVALAMAAMVACWEQGPRVAGRLVNFGALAAALCGAAAGLAICERLGRSRMGGAVARGRSDPGRARADARR